MSDSIDAELFEWEEIACSVPDSREKQIIGKLVSAVRSLQHELRDPNYQYVGRIHRQAIISRNARIEDLEKQIRELKGDKK